MLPSISARYPFDGPITPPWRGSQKPSRQATADAVGGMSTLRTPSPAHQNSSQTLHCSKSAVPARYRPLRAGAPALPTPPVWCGGVGLFRAVPSSATAA